MISVILQSKFDDNKHDPATVYPVFVSVKTSLSVDQKDHLEKAGIYVPKPKSSQLTGNLTEAEINDLAKLSWVNYIKESERLRYLKNK